MPNAYLPPQNFIGTNNTFQNRKKLNEAPSEFRRFQGGFITNFSPLGHIHDVLHEPEKVKTIFQTDDEGLLSLEAMKPGLEAFRASGNLGELAVNLFEFAAFIKQDIEHHFDGKDILKEDLPFFIHEDPLAIEKTLLKSNDIHESINELSFYDYKAFIDMTEPERDKLLDDEEQSISDGLSSSAENFFGHLAKKLFSGEITSDDFIDCLVKFQKMARAFAQDAQRLVDQKISNREKL